MACFHGRLNLRMYATYYGNVDILCYMNRMYATMGFVKWNDTLSGV
jgi:hypothetical protein